METDSVVKLVEFSVPTQADDVLTFRIEILKKRQRRKHVFVARLYRLELLRFEVRQGGADNRAYTDYRCWVVDDNLGIGDKAYDSERAALKDTLATLENQLSVALPRMRRDRKGRGRGT